MFQQEVTDLLPVFTMETISAVVKESQSSEPTDKPGAEPAQTSHGPYQRYITSLLGTHPHLCIWSGSSMGTTGNRGDEPAMRRRPD
jgi:hypothetical protein